MTASHPLSQYVARSGISIAELAKRAGVSRMTIYRLIKGEQNATISLLEQVSAATDGDVPVNALLPLPARKSINAPTN
jgi:transcriptional regulator with XRE-family HTH domain